MTGLLRITMLAVVATLPLATLTSCRKPKDAVKSDLNEAGYQITAVDWFRATRDNDVSAMKKFVSAGFDINTLDASGDSALHVAAAAGAHNTADFLLDRGLQVDLRGANDRTPLMSAALAGRTVMVRWLVKQGANPAMKDAAGFEALMLAVRENRSGPVAELAPLTRERLDSAILLAAMEGHADVIDVLTNYGASVYTRMDDGRTPLMIAAQNGKTDAVKILLDIGAGRLATDADGRSAADLASAAGHADIAALINRDPLPAELALESDEEISNTMDLFVDTATAKSQPADANDSIPLETTEQSDPPNSPPLSHSPPTPLAGVVLSASVKPAVTAETSESPTAARQTRAENFPLPPIVMRHYREREVPIRVASVTGDTAVLQIRGKSTRELNVRAEDPIPGSSLVVVRVEQRSDISKLNEGRPTDISVVEVKDTRTGATRKWTVGLPSNAHDPIALVEDAATGKRYTASPGQRFKSADGAEFIVTDVRPDQIVIEEATTGAVQTISLRGPLG